MRLGQGRGLSRLTVGSVVDSKVDLAKRYPSRFISVEQSPSGVLPGRVVVKHLASSPPETAPFSFARPGEPHNTSVHMRPVTVVTFLWGDYGKTSWVTLKDNIATPKQRQVDSVTYINRLFRGIVRNYDGPFRFIVFVDATNKDVECLPGVEVREMSPPCWEGCLPKLWAFNCPANGIPVGERVIAHDVDTVITGSLNTMYQWQGGFICRENEHKAGEPGGGMLSFEAGTMNEVYELMQSDPSGFVSNTTWKGCRRYGKGGSERAVYIKYRKPDTFWQREFPGLMQNYNRPYSKLVDQAQKRDILDKSAVFVFGGPRCHDMPLACTIRKIWESGDKEFKVRLSRDMDKGGSLTQAMSAPFFDTQLQLGTLSAGIRFVGEGEEVDATITHDLAFKGPRILHQTMDSVGINPEQVEFMRQPRSYAFIRQSITRRSGGTVAPWGGMERPTPADVRDRIVTPWGFLGLQMRDKRKPFNYTDKQAARTARPNDVFFAGTVRYGTVRLGAQDHREAMLKVLEGMKGLNMDIVRGVNDKRPMGFEEYRKHLLDAKIVLSPWGLGESCIRDWEAILAGCLVIKPQSDGVESGLDIYAHDAGFLFYCKPDWSDLEEVVKAVLAKWPDTKARMKRREVVLREDDMQYVGRRLGRMLWHAMHADSPAPAEPLKESLKDVDMGKTIGILTEFGGRHRWYATACTEMGVKHKIIDITAPDWIDAVRSSGCDGFLVRPTARTTVENTLYDERVRVMVEDLGCTVYPEEKGMWVYESKRKMTYWCQANNVPHPQTWVFYDKDKALAFVKDCPLPLVGKRDLSSASSGIVLLKTHAEAAAYVKKMFTTGEAKEGYGDVRDVQWGNVILQQYLEGAKEWRIIRVGESYFGWRKLPGANGFNSGSHQAEWGPLPHDLLDAAKDITTRTGLTSVSFDFLLLPDGSWRVIEVQALFGHPYGEDGSGVNQQCFVDDKPGRYRYLAGTWQFEQGNFSRNNCSNLRVEALLRNLSKKEKTQ